MIRVNLLKLRPAGVSNVRISCVRNPRPDGTGLWCSASPNLVEEVHDERYPVSQRLLDRHQDRKALTIRSHRYTTHSFPRMVRDRYGRPWMHLAWMKNSTLEGKRSDHDPQRREESSEKDLPSRRGPTGVLPIAPTVHHP